MMDGFESRIIAIGMAWIGWFVLLVMFLHGWTLQRGAQLHYTWRFRLVESCRSWHRALYRITQDHTLKGIILIVTPFAVQVLNRFAVYNKFR